MPQPNSTSRFTVWAIVAATVFAGTVALLTTLGGNGVDRNVPGATTGPGRSSLDDKR
jgi:hypothetical protein